MIVKCSHKYFDVAPIVTTRKYIIVRHGHSQFKLGEVWLIRHRFEEIPYTMVCARHYILYIDIEVLDIKEEILGRSIDFVGIGSNYLYIGY